MRFLQQHAEIIIVSCVVISLGLCGALYWIFNYAYTDTVILTPEPKAYVVPAETPAASPAEPATGGATP